MNRFMVVVAAALTIVITCQTGDGERDERVIFETEESIIHTNDGMHFLSKQGMMVDTGNAPCLIEEGIIPPAGSDMRVLPSDGSYKSEGSNVQN